MTCKGALWWRMMKTEHVEDLDIGRVAGADTRK